MRKNKTETQYEPLGKRASRVTTYMDVSRMQPLCRRCASGSVNRPGEGQFSTETVCVSHPSDVPSWHDRRSWLGDNIVRLRLLRIFHGVWKYKVQMRWPLTLDALISTPTSCCACLPHLPLLSRGDLRWSSQVQPQFLSRGSGMLPFFAPISSTWNSSITPDLFWNAAPKVPIIWPRHH